VSRCRTAARRGGDDILPEVLLPAYIHTTYVGRYDSHSRHMLTHSNGTRWCYRRASIRVPNTAVHYTRPISTHYFSPRNDQMMRRGAREKKNILVRLVLSWALTTPRSEQSRSIPSLASGATYLAQQAEAGLSACVCSPKTATEAHLCRSSMTLLAGPNDRIPARQPCVLSPGGPST